MDQFCVSQKEAHLKGQCEDMAAYMVHAPSHLDVEDDLIKE